MSNYVPLYVFLICLLVVGVGLPLFIGPFVDVSSYDSDSIIAPFITFLDQGLSISFFGLGSFDLNVFFWLPQFAKDYMLNYLNTFSYIPNVLAVPLMLIMFISLSYTIIKFFWGS